MRPELTARAAVVLLEIIETDTAGGKLTVRGLAESTSFSKPCITRALDVLEGRLLAKRVPDPKDRRSIFAMPTERGFKFAERLAGATP